MELIAVGALQTGNLHSICVIELPFKDPINHDCTDHPAEIF